jgi:hypothetical protein
MKNISFLLLVLVALVSCEKPSDCVESTGEFVSRDVLIDMPTANDSIKKIYVEKGIELIVSEGPIFKVTIQTGSNLIDDIEVSREGNMLRLKDNTTCNWVREFGQTKVLVTTPKLEEIYSKTDRNISSNGVLTFSKLKIVSVDDNADHLEGAGTGDFFINVNNNELQIESNNVSRFYLSGNTTLAKFLLWAGDSRIEAQNLNATNIEVFHRGSNDMTVKPLNSIYGVINSTGNVILTNNPPTVNVQQLYQGHLIYN